MLDKTQLSADARKCLENNLGDEAGREIANLLGRMAKQIVELRRNKVNIIELVPQQGQDS